MKLNFCASGGNMCRLTVVSCGGNMCRLTVVSSGGNMCRLTVVSSGGNMCRLTVVSEGQFNYLKLMQVIFELSANSANLSLCVNIFKHVLVTFYR